MAKTFPQKLPNKEKEDIKQGIGRMPTNPHLQSKSNKLRPRARATSKPRVRSKSKSKIERRRRYLDNGRQWSIYIYLLRSDEERNASQRMLGQSA